jgi:small subunit ribosomal protein S2
VKEARKLGIPVVAVLDTNCDPTVVDYIIPGNDDALRAIRLFTSKISDSVVEGVQTAGEKRSIDAGVTADAQLEAPAAEAGSEAAAGESPADNEEVDLEAALGGGIRKAPGVIAAVDEPEAIEGSL